MNYALNQVKRNARFQQKNKYGKGIIMTGLSMEEAFKQISCVPDCKLPEDRTIHYGHRTSKNGEFYFVTNQTGETKVISPEFRVKGLQPELWEPTTGSMRKLVAYEQKKNTTVVPMKLVPYESVFVVFRQKAGLAKSNKVESNYPEPTLLTEIKGPWLVQFDKTQRGPEQQVVFETLHDWSTSLDDRIKYYSGTAFYINKFTLGHLPEGKKIVINLGSFTAMAKVSINGKYVGGLWTPPYQLDITESVKTGENDLKIELVNTWVNRLIGDSKLPEKQRKTWCPINSYKPESPLQASGLFGPVTVSSIQD